MKPQAFVFDAYGTLFDIHSVVHRAALNLTGDVEALSRRWREKQIEYTWRRALMNRYVDFFQVTEQALRSAARHLRIDLTEAHVAGLMEAYLSPPLFADVRMALDALKPGRLAILSNGSPAMLAAAVAAHGMESDFEHVLSADRIKAYKPSPAVYALGTEALDLRAGEILFVSSNAWDAAGAKAFGYRVCWCNRSGQDADALGFEPDFTIAGLHQLAGRF